MVGMFIFNFIFGSGVCELLKWVVLLVMIGDYVVKVVFGGYVLVVSELGCIVFLLFVLVMVCNLV